MIIELVAIIIAVISLVLSIYIIFRDRKIKRLDNLHTCRQNILNKFESKDILTVDEIIDFFEDNPDSDKAKKHQAKSKELTFQVDREFEYTCYLVLKKQIDFDSFFDLFKRWLAIRRDVWNVQLTQNKINLPYTWKVIELCEKKQLLPLKKLTP